jgi:hypothetical protein
MGLMCPNHKSYQPVIARENLHKKPVNERASEVVSIKLACGCVFPVDEVNEYQIQIKDVIDEAAKRKNAIDREMREAISAAYAGIKKGKGK